MKHPLINLVAFQCCWLASVLGAAASMPWLGLLFAAVWLPLHIRATGAAVAIETKLINLRIIGGTTRFWTPSIAVGDSRIDLDLRLVDATTGDEVANVEIRANARKWGSAYTGVSDETIDDYVVAIVYDYLSDHY